ncbi:hypothetical protein BGP75_23570 [Motiliproteus sp. MSK22-1]|nr:hypothetical protein BGP75_23570 [Motiliproteus sp. MSK22-1]
MQNLAPAVKTQNCFETEYKKSDFREIPNNINMIWVASEPQEEQLKYVKDWAKKNPDFNLNFWVDSKNLTTHAGHKEVKNEVNELLSDVKSSNQEMVLRGLFNQLKTSMNHLPDESHQAIAIKELNKALDGDDYSDWKSKVLGDAPKVNRINAKKALQSFETVTGPNDEKFRLADRAILDHTVRQWDTKDSKVRDVKTLDDLSEKLSEFKNIKVRDLSSTSNIRLVNYAAYSHEMIGRGGAYPAASDLARYEILNDSEYAGVYVDLDFECIKPLDKKKLLCHPDLLLVDIGEAKADEKDNSTPYIGNALLASHPNSKMLNTLIQEIGDNYSEMKGNTFRGSRYFDRPNKSTLETTGPNALRGHISKTLGEPRQDVDSLMNRIWDKKNPVNDNFWKAMYSHFKFPAGFVNGDTPEQAKSATKAMATMSTPKIDGKSQVKTSTEQEKTVIGIGELKEILQDTVNAKKQEGKPSIVFLSGPSASGKSTLSTALKALTDKEIPTVKTDHFLKSFPELSNHPENKGKPVSDWPVVHGHPDAYNKEELGKLMDAVKKGEEYVYSIPSTYREDAKLDSDPYPRGMRNTEGPYKEVKVPASQTYIIEGISTPHLIDSNEHVYVQVDVDYETSVLRRAERNSGHNPSGNGSPPESVVRAEDKAQYDAVTASHKALREKSITPDISLDSTGQKPGQFQYMNPKSNSTFNRENFINSLRIITDNSTHPDINIKIASFLNYYPAIHGLEEKVAVSKLLVSENILSRIHSSDIPEKDKFSLINKLISMVDQDVPNGRKLSKDEKIIKENILLGVVGFSDSINEIDPKFDNRFPEKPFVENRKVLVNIGNISGGGDISLGMKTAASLAKKLGNDNVSVVIRKYGSEDSLDLSIISKQYKDISIIKKEDANSFNPDLILMVPARSQYKAEDASMFDPGHIRKFFGLDEKTPFLGVTEYSRMNSEAKVIDSNTEILRSGAGRNNVGMFLSDNNFDKSERPISGSYFFGYSQSPNAQMNFMRDVIQAHNLKPPQDNSDFTFVFPGKISRFFDEYAKNPEWKTFLETTGCNNLTIEDMSGKKLGSTSINDKSDGPNIVIKTGNLDAKSFQKHAYFSEDTVLTTGDQSMSEMLGMGKYIVYEEQKHKKLLPVETFLKGNKSAQFSLSKMEGIYAKGKEHDGIEAKKHIDSLLPRKPREDGRPDMHSVLYNPGEGLRRYVQSPKVREDYAEFIKKIKAEDNIEENLMPAILKGDIRRKVAQW